VFSLVNPVRANRLNLQLPCFSGGESREGIIEQDRCAFLLHGSFPVISLRAFHSFRVGVKISSGCGCCECFCRVFTLTSCNMTPYRQSWSWSCWRCLARLLDCCCRAPGSLILSAEAPAVGVVFCNCCRKLGSLIISVEAPAVGNVFCICCRTLGSLILSAEAPAVGVFCFLVRSFMHVRFGSLTYLRRLTISERLISGI